jgi:hypothetical protein
MRGSDQIYPGPTWIVLAAASQLRDATLIERHGEEWLANLRHRTRRQQWRDAVSLLVRGARVTRWAYDSTYNFRPRAAAVSQVMTALAMAVGTVFLFSIPNIIKWLFFLRTVEDGHAVDNVYEFDHPPGNHFHSNFPVGDLSESALKSGTILMQYLPLTSDRYPLLYLALGAANMLGLALVIRWRRLVVVSGMTVDVLATCCVILLSHRAPTCTFSASEVSVSTIGTFWISKSFCRNDFWLYAQEFCGNIVRWGAVAAALIVFVHYKVSTIIRVLAAIEVVGILRVTFSWPYEYADRLGLRDLVQVSPDVLSSVTSGKFTAFQIAPGIAFLLSGIGIWAALRCVEITRSLIRTAGCDVAGAWICRQ